MQTHPAKQGRAANACGLRVPGFMGSAFFCSDGAVLRTHAFPAAAWACIACKEVYPCCLCGGACVLRAVSVTTRDRCFSELCVFSPLEDAASLWASQRTPRSQWRGVVRGGVGYHSCACVLFFLCLKLDPIPRPTSWRIGHDASA